jgi:hypothetical protein
MHGYREDDLFEELVASIRRRSDGCVLLLSVEVLSAALALGLSQDDVAEAFRRAALVGGTMVPIFRVKGESSVVEEIPDGLREVAFYLNKVKADAYCAHLQKEHAAGRVAQGHCNKGAKCDWQRMNRPEDVDPAIVILCAEHDARHAQTRRAV